VFHHGFQLPVSSGVELCRKFIRVRYCVIVEFAVLVSPEQNTYLSTARREARIAGGGVVKRIFFLFIYL